MVQAQSVCVHVHVRVCLSMYVCVMCVCTGVYNSCTCILCENSVRNKNQCHCKWYKPSLCVCVFVCVLHCLYHLQILGVLIKFSHCFHKSYMCMNPVCVCACACACVCVHVCVCHVCVHRRVQFMHMYTL